MKHTICVLLEIQTDDERLDPSRVEVNTIAKAATLRQAVVDNLPHNLSRVVVVMPVEVARMIMEMHDEVAEAVGLPAKRPPADYVPPTRE